MRLSDGTGERDRVLTAVQPERLGHVRSVMRRSAGRSGRGGGSAEEAVPVVHAARGPVTWLIWLLALASTYLGSSVVMVNLSLVFS